MAFDFDTPIDRIGTNSVKWEFKAEAGMRLRHWQETDPSLGDEAILPLWVADMDFRCPQPVIDALLAADTVVALDMALRDGKNVLFEGAQGTLLDVDHGTYPFVTSSSSTAGGVCTGLGVGPTKIDRVIGVVKAYTTRVGEGPFPTELEDKVGKHLLEVGREFGSTTGRTRRCGWLDLVALKYAIRINGITNLALMKIDVLSGLEELQVCTHYELDGEKIEGFIHMHLGCYKKCK